ncbi:unnamed protein product [Schistosoma haematobium]|nr:unnamed protein product [Schistosoma haematobium]
MPNCSFQDARTACINYEAVNELDIQLMKISNTLLSGRDELQSQGQSNLRSFNSDSYSRVNMKGVSTRNYKANHKGQTQDELNKKTYNRLQTLILLFKLWRMWCLN